MQEPLISKILVARVIAAKIDNRIADRIHKICIGNFLYLVATIAFHYISCASIIIHTYNNANMVSYGPAVLRVNDNNVTDLESIGTAC